jgi:transposase, IS5 family
MCEMLGAGFDVHASPYPFLREVKRRIQWEPVGRALGKAYADQGRPAWDPVLMTKLWLLQKWFQLSDRSVVENAQDRASFREFLDLAPGDPLPDYTSLHVFRERLQRHGLGEAPLAEVERQLTEQGLLVRTGQSVIVDGSLIPSQTNPGSTDEHGSPLEPEATTQGRSDGTPPTHGFKLHAAVEEETGLIAGATVTTATASERGELPELLDQCQPCEVLADKGYPSAEVSQLLRRRKVRNLVMRKKPRGGRLSEYQRRRNARIAKRRAPAEGTFGILKRCYGWARSRWRGLVKTTRELRWTITAFNLRKLHTLGWAVRSRAGPQCHPA